MNRIIITIAAALALAGCKEPPRKVSRVLFECNPRLTACDGTLHDDGVLVFENVRWKGPYFRGSSRVLHAYVDPSFDPSDSISNWIEIASADASTVIFDRKQYTITKPIRVSESIRSFSLSDLHVFVDGDVQSAFIIGGSE